MLQYSYSCWVTGLLSIVFHSERFGTKSDPVQVQKSSSSNYEQVCTESNSY